MPEPCDQEPKGSDDQAGTASQPTDDELCKMQVDAVDAKTDSTTPNVTSTPVTPPKSATPPMDISTSTEEPLAAATAAAGLSGQGGNAMEDFVAVMAAAASIKPVADYKSYYNSLVENIKKDKNVENSLHELEELMRALITSKFRGTPDDAKYLQETVLPNAQRAVLRNTSEHNVVFLRFTAMFIRFSGTVIQPLLFLPPTPEIRERLLSFLKLLLLIAQAELNKVPMAIDQFLGVAGELLQHPDNANVLSYDKYKLYLPADYLRAIILLCHAESLMVTITANSNGLCTFQHFCTIITILCYCSGSNILNNHYGRWKLVSAVINCAQCWLPRMTDEEIRAFGKEDMDKCLNTIMNMSHFYSYQTEMNAKVELLILTVALRCIKSGFIDKRVYGILCLSNVVYSFAATNRTPPVLTRDFVANWMRENTVLEFLLGPSAKTELVKECAPIVCFIFSRGDCSHDLLELTWNSVLSLHETISEAILKTLASCIGSFSYHVFDFFVAKVQAVKPQDMSLRVISFYSSLVTDVLFYERVCEQSLTFMTTLLFQHRLPVPVRQCVEQTVQKVISLSPKALQFDKWLDSFVSVIVNHVYQVPVSEDALLFSLNTIKSLISSYEYYCVKRRTDGCKRQKAVELLQRECVPNHPGTSAQEPLTFLAIVIREIILCHSTYFKSVASDGVSTVPCGSPAVATAQPDAKNHSQNEDGFQARLSFLSWHLYTGRTHLQSTDFLAIWSQLCDNYVPSHVETFLSWVVQCRYKKFCIVSENDCLSLVDAMVSLAEHGKMTPTIFDNVSHLLLSLNYVSDPSSASLSSFKCMHQLCHIVFSLQDESVFNRGAHFLLSFCPLTTEPKQAQNGPDRDNALVSILLGYILSVSDASGKIGCDDFTLSLPQLVRALELLTRFLQQRNDNGYNSFLLPTSVGNSETPMTVYISYCGAPVFAIETVSTETLGGLRRLVAKRLESYAQTLCLDKMTFFRNGAFFPSEGWSESDLARSLKECGVCDGALLRVTIPEDISANENKLILRASGKAAVRCDTTFNEMDKTSDSTEQKQLNPEEIGALVEDVCLQTKVDRELVLFVLGHCKWDKSVALEVLESEEKLQGAQTAFEASKKGDAPSSPASSSVASSGPSQIARLLSEHSELFHTLYALISSSNLSVSGAAWKLLQQIPVHPALVQALVTEKFSPDFFSTAAPYFLSYNLHIVELVLSTPGANDLTQCLVANGTLAHIASSVLPSLNPPPTTSLRDALATCIAIVTRGFGVAGCPSIPTAQSLEILRFVAEQSSSPTSNDSAIVARVFALINACAAGTTQTITDVMPLFSAPNAEHSLLYKLLVDHSDVDVRRETAQGVLRIFSALKGANEESAKCRMFLLNRLESMIPFQPTPQEAEQCQQFFELIEGVCHMCAAAGQCDSQSHVRNMELYQKFVESHLPRWVDALLQRPVVESFSQGSKSGSGTDFFMAGIAKVVRCTLMLFPSLTSIFFGPKQVQAILDDVLFYVSDTLSKDCLPKAKRDSTRAAVIDLLIEAAAHCPDDAHIVSEYLSHELPLWAIEYANDEQCTKTWSFDPSSYTRSELGFVGLYNSGNLCYMNSVMQQLFHIPRLRRAILAIDVNKLTCDDKLRKFAEEFQKLFYFMEHSVQRQVNPRPFLSAFAHVTEGFRETQQHDADEFLNILWQRLEQALKDTPQWEPLNAIFAGKVRHEIKSMNDALPYVRHSYEDFHVLSLDISDKKSLADALSFFIQPDRLSGENAYFCEKYNCKIDVSKHAMLQHLPPILAIHLKRFAYNPTEDRMVKLHERLEFPQNLSMEPYTVEDSDDTSPRRFFYKLRGVVVHSGECQSGHYYSFVNTQSPSEAEGSNSSRWLKFNDSDVDVFAENQLEQQCFGGTKIETTYTYNYPTSREVPKTNSAYMLFYERCDLSDTEQDTVPVTNTSDECPTTVLSGVMNTENHHFIHEAYLSNHSLFFLLESLWSMHHHVCDPRTFVLLFLSVVCHSCIKSQFISTWANHLCIMLRNDPEFAAWYIGYIQQANVIRTYVLPSSPSEIVRVKVADTIIAAMNSAAPLEQHLWPRYKDTLSFDSDKRASVLGQQTPVLNLLDHLISLLDPCREHWQTFRQYFRLFHEFSKLGPLARTALMEADIGSRFANWFNSPSKVKVLNSSYFPDLRDFFNTLQTVWCGCYQGPDHNARSPYSCDGELVVPLPNFYDSVFLKTNFFLFMTHPYNPAAIARMACHYCYNDVAATKRVLRACIRSFEGNGLERVPSNRIICAILDINDSLRDARCNFIMTPYLFHTPSGTGILGMLQLSLNRSDSDLRSDLELLTHCCKSTYGFTSALHYRGFVDWIDSLCVARLAKAMAAHPSVFKRLCLDDDESVLTTKDATEYASTDIVVAFQHIRALVRRMDSMTPCELADHATFWREHQEALVRDALCAARENKPVLWQPEWKERAESLECGRVTPPVNPYASTDRDVMSTALALPPVVNDGEYDFNSCPGSPYKNSMLSPAEIDALVAQARDITCADEETVRAALRQNNYDLTRTVNMLV